MAPEPAGRLLCLAGPRTASIRAQGLRETSRARGGCTLLLSASSTLVLHVCLCTPCPLPDPAVSVSPSMPPASPSRFSSSHEAIRPHHILQGEGPVARCISERFPEIKSRRRDMPGPRVGQRATPVDRRGWTELALLGRCLCPRPGPGGWAETPVERVILL